MKNSPEDEYAPTKKRYFLAGVAGRVTGNAIRRQERSGKPIITVKIIDSLGTRLLKEKPLSTTTRESIQEAFEASKYWHGTGRYQYKNGERVDVLNFIITHRALTPQHDTLDLTGPMESLSLAKSRMYARAYADMHGKASKEVDRHGSSTFWAWTFAGDIYGELINETKLWKRKNRIASRKHFNEGGTSSWPSKVSTISMPVPEIFNRGSDIEGNYPILFGIRDSSFKAAATSRSVAIHEARSLQPLSLDGDVTHIELPRAHLNEVLALLKQNNLTAVPVFTIEECEQYASELPLSKLIAGI
jgi:hypothetical protein